MDKTLLVIFTFFYMSVSNAQIKNDRWLEPLLRKDASPLLLEVFNKPDIYQYQVIYTKIDRDKNNLPKFTNYYLNVERDRYFYPASMVKLPTALVALEKINTLKEKGIDKYSDMLTDSAFSGQTVVVADSSSPTGKPSIDHYVKKIFVVSDNDAYNRLYEFCGQQYLNETLWKKGYKDLRITRRFVKMTLEENRHTNPIRFFEKGVLKYRQPAQQSHAAFTNAQPILIGKGHWDANDSLVNTPFDFTGHNRVALEDLQLMLQSVLFPESVPQQRQFHLSSDDYHNLYQYLSEKPSESKFPKYDTSEFFDSYTKFFFFRDGKQKIPDHIHIYNKAGWSHGFLTDVCYVVDFRNNIEWMLSGTIYLNSDGILNDNKYEYEEMGYPFFREVGEKIYEYELRRKRPVIPDLGKWKRVTYD